MKKIKSQFDALRSGRQIAEGGCCCCCCCSCIATIIGFSIGTARHIRAKAEEYNAQSATPVNVVAYTIFASLFFTIATATTIGLLFLFDPKEWDEIVAGVAVGVLLNFSIFAMLCKRINIKIQYPIAIIAGFAAVSFAEFWIWMAIILH